MALRSVHLKYLTGLNIRAQKWNKPTNWNAVHFVGAIRMSVRHKPRGGNNVERRDGFDGLKSTQK